MTAAILDLGPLKNSAHTFARGIPAKSFIQPSKKPNQQKHFDLLSTVTELLKMTQLTCVLYVVILAISEKR